MFMVRGPKGMFAFVDFFEVFKKVGLREKASLPLTTQIPSQSLRLPSKKPIKRYM